MNDKRIRKVIKETREQFWKLVKQSFPEVGGALIPATMHERVNEVIADAVHAWVRVNC